MSVSGVIYSPSPGSCLGGRKIPVALASWHCPACMGGCLSNILHLLHLLLVINKHNSLHVFN